RWRARKKRGTAGRDRGEALWQSSMVARDRCVQQYRRSLECLCRHSIDDPTRFGGGSMTMSAGTSLPALSIELNGESLSGNAAGALEEVRVQHRLSQPSMCELTFFVTRDPIAELKDLRAGSPLRLLLPYDSASLFEGEITALEYGYEAGHGST